MGSTSDPLNLTSSSSPSLILTNPSPEERTHIWTLTHPMWGPALSRADYLGREAYLMTVPLAKEGGITHWILTETGKDQRLVLSSCETPRRRALVAIPTPASGADGDGAASAEVREGWAHGIASVFTEERFRGRGYAGRMLAELGPVLGRWQAAADAGCLFSVLFSAIGKAFYARKGWAAHESRHLAFPPAA